MTSDQYPTLRNRRRRTRGDELLLIRLRLTFASGVAFAVILASWGSAENVKGQQSVVRYEDDSAVFANPERGFYQAFHPPGGGRVGQQDQPHAPLDADVLRSLRDRPEAITLIRDDILIPRRFWGGNISAEFLDDVQRNFDAVRTAGLKVIVRVLYDWGMTNRDPDEPTIVRHLDQLTPLLSRNADIVAWVQAGLFGGCGEGNASDQGYIVPKHRGAIPIRHWQGLSEAGRRIYQRWLEAIPRDRIMAVRYPRLKWDLFGWTAASAQPLQERTAFSEAKWARVGYYNQGFMGNAQHYAMYVLPGEGAFAGDDSLYTVHKGEISSAGRYKFAKGRVVAEMVRAHLSALNCGGDGWSEVAGHWKANGDYDEINRRMGYRFRLLQAILPKSAKAGESLRLSLEMRNDGFARAVNARGVEVILRGPEERYSLMIDSGRGNRLWLPGPGEIKVLRIFGRLPADIRPDRYEIFLNLPDPAPSLQQRPEYSIRLANKSVWNAETGYNSLNHSIDVEVPAAVDPRAPASPSIPPFRRQE